MTQIHATEVRRTGWRPFVSALSRPIFVLLCLQLMGGIILSPHRTFFPIYLKELGHPVLVIAALSTIQQIAGLIGSWVGGALSDLLGRKPTLLLGQLGPLLASLAFLTPWPGLIVPLWALNGFCGGVHTVGAQSYLLDAAQPGFLGLLTAFYNWGTTLGGALGSPLAGWVLDGWGYRAFGMLLGLLSLAALATNLLFLPTSAGPAESRTTGQSRLFHYGNIIVRPTVIVLALLRFLPTLYWGMALTLIPLLFTAAGASKTTVALYATVSQVAASLGQIIVGRVADRAGCKWVVVITFAVLVSSILGTGILSDRLEGLFIFGTLGTTAAWSLSTLLPSLVAHAMEPEERGRVLGWVHLWWNLGMILGALGGGFLFTYRTGLPFLAVAGLNCASIALVFVFFRLSQSRAGREPGC